MNKKIKLFIACCNIAQTAICSTTEVKADITSNEKISTFSQDFSTSSRCVGSGTCGIIQEGTFLVGK